MPNLDRLCIRDLQVRCHLGVTAAERSKPQDVLITVSLHADLARAALSDRLADSIDYKAIKVRIQKIAESRPYNLIERLAQIIADDALSDRRVAQVDVTIQKPGALRFARCSEVEISRTQKPESKSRKARQGKG